MCQVEWMVENLGCRTFDHRSMECRFPCSLIESELQRFAGRRTRRILGRVTFGKHFAHGSSWPDDDVSLSLAGRNCDGVIVISIRSDAIERRSCYTIAKERRKIGHLCRLHVDGIGGCSN